MENQEFVVSNLAEYKFENNLYSKANICNGYSVKDFTEYVKLHGIQPIIVRQQKSNQKCGFYTEAQKNEIQNYLDEKKLARIQSFGEISKGYKPVRYVAELLGIERSFLLYLSKTNPIFRCVKKIKDENNRNLTVIKCDEETFRKYKEFIIVNKGKITTGEFYQSNIATFDEHKAQLEEVFNQDMTEYNDMLDLLEAYDQEPLTQKKGYEIHHVIPRFYFGMKHIPVDESKYNLVNLPIEKHFMVHFLAYKCCKEKYRIKFFGAVSVLGGRIEASGLITDKMNIRNLTNNVYADYRDWGHVDRVKRLVSENIVQKLEEKQFNRQKFCEITGISQTVLNDIISCNKYTFDDVIVVCNALGTNLLEMMVS